MNVDNGNVIYIVIVIRNKVKNVQQRRTWGLCLRGYETEAGLKLHEVI